MFRWFAPLLLFAGKPDVLVRIVTLVIAGAVMAFGIWAMSHIALTFDALKNPYIAAIYGVVLLCLFIIVGVVTWLRLRRLGTAEPPRLGRPTVDAPPLSAEIVSRRADAMSRQWARDARPKLAAVSARAVASPALAQAAAAPAGAAVRASLVVTGPAYSGKTALITRLMQATSGNPAETSDIVRLIDTVPTDGDAGESDALAHAAADGVLFVVDQDLRAPEVAAIAALSKSGKPVYVVLNKADQFTAADRDRILLAIRAKLPGKFAPGHVVSVASAPSPVEREIEDARGAVRVEVRQPASDMRALMSLLGRIFAPAPGRTLRFEAA